MKTIAVPDAEILRRLGAPPEGIRYIVADVHDLARAESASIDLLVLPYMSDPALVSLVDPGAVSAVQSQSIGYDGVTDRLPAGVSFHNAASVHESSTAELAVGLALASQRGIADFVRAQASGSWQHQSHPSLADRRVMVLGIGGVGGKVVERLAPFEVELVRVARSHREDAAGTVYGIDELPTVLPTVDIVIIAVPLSPSTRGMVDRAFLAAMPDDALLVNVSRGAIVDTGALLAEVQSGRLRAALDVTDPEPLPPEHPLWRAPGVLITPHVGGDTSAMLPRVDALVRRQAQHLAAGEPLENQVLPR
ncbi:MAG: NAD(P)-dependent oxidoreductase [Microbacteriaceae bacterium]